MAACLDDLPYTLDLTATDFTPERDNGGPGNVPKRGVGAVPKKLWARMALGTCGDMFN